MKKYIIITILVALPILLKSQSIATNYTTDWNSIKNSGFFQYSTANTSNSPDSQIPYYWGLNIAHDDSRYKGQLAFSVNFNSDNPQMYIRSTNVSGGGIWAKVITNKGDQEIAGKLKVREISVEITASCRSCFQLRLPTKTLVGSRAICKGKQTLTRNSFRKTNAGRRTQHQ